jgi:hypothetical protein
MKLKLEIGNLKNPKRNLRFTNSFIFISKNYLKSENCKLEFNYALALKKKRIFFVLERLDPTDVNGIEMHLYGDSVRMDVFKLQKGPTVDNNLAKEIYKRIAPALRLINQKLI